MWAACRSVQDLFLGPKEYNIVVDGLAGCGKTAVINRFLEGATKKLLQNEKGCLLYYKHAILRIHEGFDRGDGLFSKESNQRQPSQNVQSAGESYCYSQWFVKSCSAEKDKGFTEALERLYLAVTNRDCFHTTGVESENVNPHIIP